MSREQATVSTHDEIISYQKLRTFIGLTGVSLPVLVIVGCLLTGAGKHSFQVSISHFYYSKMHIVFVGVLCVLGGFLITYRGKKGTWEGKWSNAAGFCSFAIAACPTTIGDFQDVGAKNQYLQICAAVTRGWGFIHLAFAGALFFCFVIFCLKYFQIADGNYTGEEERKFKKRKRIYKFCGWSIIVSIAMIAVFYKINPTRGLFRYSTFIFETTALFAFGSAWLVKGSAMWKAVPVAKELVKGFR